MERAQKWRSRDLVERPERHGRVSFAPGFMVPGRLAADPWGRNRYGISSQGRADYASWQHIIKSMKPKSGRCAILFPHGVLFRNEEAAMREKLIAHDVAECVLGLGPNLFYNAPMEACVVICRMRKPPKRRNNIWRCWRVMWRWGGSEAKCPRATCMPCIKSCVRRRIAGHCRSGVFLIW